LQFHRESVGWRREIEWLGDAENLTRRERENQGRDFGHLTERQREGKGDLKWFEILGVSGDEIWPADEWW
jgi:hypothetical protein